MLDDQNNVNEERVTLTQRRTGVVPGADKMARNKLGAIGPEPAPAENGSPAKVIVWVVIVVVLAVGAYLALRNVLKQPDTTVVTQTPTPTAELTLEEQLVSQEILDDELASNIPTAAQYVMTDQTAGRASDAQYTIQGLQVQKYTSFTRLSYIVTNNEESAEAFPLVTTAYNSANKLLTLTFNSISSDDSGLGYYDTVNLDTSNISTLTHDGETTNMVEKYVLKMKDNQGVILHTFTENGENFVVLDVKENAVAISGTPAVTGTTAPVSTATPAATGTVTPTGTQTTTELQTQFSKTSQEINTGTTGNTTQVVRYNYGDGSTVFTWNLYLNVSKDKYPNVSASIQDNKLVILVSNYLAASKSLSTINFTGVRDISKVEVSVTDHVAKYEFYLNKPMDYRMLFEEANNILRFEIKH